MPFPLPIDPYFRKEIVWMWIQDVSDRLQLEGIQSAEESWKIALEIYLSLPAGQGSDDIETALSLLRVKLDNLTYETNENN
jgi:hypothetical protein